MNNQKPAYLQLYEKIRDKITQGVWEYGERLPSRRETAREDGLSAITVEHSYELLCQEGYIESRPRSGYYVIYRPLDGFAQVSPRPLRPAAPAGYASDRENSFPFSVLARTMRRVMTEYGETLLNKSPNTGCDALRQAISRYLARNRGMAAAPEQIVIGSGAEYLYGLVVEMLGRGKVYAIESPSYEKIEQVYRAKGVACDLLPLEHDGIRSAALSATRASVLHITPYRSFPSGVTASASKRREYIHWAEDNDRFIVEDDFESEFSLLRKPEETVFSRSKKENVIYLNTFSRTVSPSIRVGYMVLPPRLIPLFAAAVGFYSCTVPAFEQYVLAQLMDNGDFERHINRIRRMERKKRTGKSV
ncbi:MAG: PLP-dependent aminotransferase family protein [Clostridia bacterium]|nr:PLP-dependent aminotransferase family protein [Clostridia bacterium]